MWYNSHMKNVVYRLTHNRDGDPLNPLIHIFFFITFVNGIAFTFFTGTHTVATTALFEQTVHMFGTMPLPIWGLLAIAAALINWLAIVTRHRRFLGYAGMLGWAVWLFTFFIYLFGGLWFQVFAATIPNMIFWVWYYFRVKWYYKP